MNTRLASDTGVTSYVHGQDGMGWSIDADRAYTLELLEQAGIAARTWPLGADVAHFVWWNQALRWRRLKVLVPRQKWLAVATNLIGDDTADFARMRGVVDFWVAANRTQLDWFERQGVACGYQPFYVDERVFLPMALSRAELCHYLGVDPARLGDRVLVGSFQRDSLGSDLGQPKWQKGPDVLLDILRHVDVPRERWMVLLAGPRRHWVASQLERAGIDYLFVGEHPRAGVDDMAINTLDRHRMALLYNLADLYIVSSKSEGGPKAVIEAGLCRRAIISTPVGLAPDLLISSAIYQGVEDGVRLASLLIGSTAARQDNARANYASVYRVCHRQAAIERWQAIYTRLMTR